MTQSRAKLSPDLIPLAKLLPEFLPTLESGPGWYGSIYLERKSARNLTVNLKATNVSDQVTLGVVFRIYNGFTLFEQATDDLNPASLKQTVSDFTKRVAATAPPKNAENRPYHPPTWAERMATPLESEISSQIPKGANARTHVHFGVKFQKDPKAVSTETRIQELKDILNGLTQASIRHGFAPGELSYAMVRQLFSEEESIFIDRETLMSQSLYRIALTVLAMSGSDRTFTRVGGLGGLEAVEFSDQERNALIEDLSGLKNAERLVPGKYRVLFSPTLTGVLAHEAFGHSQEGDTCARGRSKAWEIFKTGALVGNPHATILNNPAIFESADKPYAAWGSYFFDEEGWLAQEQVILDQGKLKAPMTNLTSAIRLGVPRTANGKRESWANGVYTRQTNTYFSAGKRTLAELMSQIDDGFVAVHPGGGMEDPKGMGIQVGIHFLKEVKNGKATGRYFKGPNGGDIQLTGYTPDVLNSIVDKSKIEYDKSAPDQSRHPMNDVGGCGKYHKELVHAGCGGPWMLLDQVILG